MDLKFEQYLFPEYHTLYDAATDPNKDSDNKGTQERYMESIGKELDDNTVPFIDNMQPNLLEPQSAISKFVVYLESGLGYQLNWDWFFVMPLSFRRNLLDIMPKLYQIRGTLLCHQIMIGWLGYNVTINEVYSNDDGFDSDDDTFDSDDDTFDSTCEPCSTYTINLSGKPWDVNDVVAITTILEFNQPINAVLTDITYAGGGLSQYFMDFDPDFNYDFSNVAPPYIPINDLIAWFKPEIGIILLPSPPVPYNVVAVWQDQSGNGNHLSQQGGFLQAGDMSIAGNGYDAVKLTGTGFLQTGTISQFNSTNKLTVIFVCSIDWVVAHTNQILGMLNYTNDAHWTIGSQSTSQEIIEGLMFEGGNADKGNNHTTNSLALHFVEFDRSTTLITPETYGVTPSLVQSPLSLTGNFSNGRLQLGDLNNSGDIYGYFQEIKIIGNVLSAMERAAEESYFATKYGL